MFFIVVFISMMVGSLAQQRPSFAGSRPIGRPDLAARFKDENEPTGQTLANRVGEGSGTTEAPRGVNYDRVNEWPQENRPFEVVNSQHIKTHLHPDSNRGQVVRSRTGASDNTVTQSRPFFAGTRPVGRPDVAPRFKDDSTQAINSRAGEGTTAGDGLSYTDRVNSWPRENRPFEVVNADHIKASLHPQDNRDVQSRSGFQDTVGSGASGARPSFAGSRSIGRPEVAARFRE